MSVRCEVLYQPFVFVIFVAVRAAEGGDESPGEFREGVFCLPSTGDLGDDCKPSMGFVSRK